MAYSLGDGHEGSERDVVLQGLSQPREQYQGIPRRSGPPSASTLNSNDFSLMEDEGSVQGSTQGGGERESLSNPQSGGSQSNPRIIPQRGAPRTAPASPMRTSTVQGRTGNSPQRPSTVGLRTPMQAWGTAGEPDLPADFPKGPYASLSLHMDRIQAWSKDFSSGGGRFTLVNKEDEVAQGVQKKTRGARVRLYCNRGGSRTSRSAPHAGGRQRASIRCNCPCQIVLEVCRIAEAPDLAQGPSASADLAGEEVERTEITG